MLTQLLRHPADLPPAGKPSVSPFTEPVGINPADRTAALSTPLHEYGQYLLTCLPKFIQQFSVYKDELTLYTFPQGVVPVLTFLRDHTNTQYKAVMDITAVDYPTKSQRFEVSAVNPPTFSIALTYATNVLASPSPFTGRLQPPLNLPQLSNQTENLRR